MSVILSKIDNIFEYKYLNINHPHKSLNSSSNSNKNLYYDSNINLIFYDKYKNHIKDISVNKLNNYLDFIKNMVNYDSILLFSYNYNGENRLLAYLEKSYNLELLKFCNINLFYYCVINVKKDLRIEKIMKDLSNEIEININIDYEFQYKDLKNEIYELDLKINIFVKKVKDYSLQDIEKQRKNLELKFNNLDLFMTEVNKTYELVNKIVNENNEYLKTETNRIGILKNKNMKETELESIESKQFYLINLLKKIEINEKKQIKKIDELNNINKLIDEKSNVLYNKNKDIEEKKYIIGNIGNNKIHLNNEIDLLRNEIMTLKKEKLQRQKILNRKKDDKNIIIKNIGVFVHIFNISLFDEISEYLKNLKSYGITFDLLVNISVNNLNDTKKEEYRILIEKINKLEVDDICDTLYLTYSDNKGMDIGGFFKSYINILESNIGYEYILKLHTKTNDNWRFAMFYSLMGNEKIVKNNLFLLKQKNIGMIGNELISLSDIRANMKSFKYIGVYLSRFNVTYNNKGNFIPGTCFWIKGDVLRRSFNIQNLTDCYNEFEKDYCGSKENKIEGKPHAFERFFGLMVDNCRMETVRFDHSL